MNIDKKYSSQSLNTAVLFLVFKRLDTTKQVFETIRHAKPSRFYIAADGARDKIDAELFEVEKVRNYLLSNIDWECEVKTLFREKNLGCMLAVSEAIDWFFDSEEMGIILEDDCLPNKSFFWFCEELLLKYKDDIRVWHISGNNFQKDLKQIPDDFYFSIYPHIWGWATWRNRWKKYDMNLNKFDNDNFIKFQFNDKYNIEYWKRIFKMMKRQPIDTWDYQWVFTMWLNKGLAILPSLNLVSNIGFGTDATHTQHVNEFTNLKAYELELKNYPTIIERNFKADEFTSKHIFLNKRSFYQKLINKLKSIF